MDDMLDDFDQDKMMKELEKEMDKNLKNKDCKTESEEENKALDEEQLVKLRNATHDDLMLADKDGKIYRVEEIDFIIKDVLKHQNKAFKNKREVSVLDETVEEVKDFVNHWEEKKFVKHDAASLKYTDTELIKSQRGVLLYLARRIGVNLLTGKSIMNVSLPIKIFEPSSFLEKWAKDFRYSSHYLKLAMASQDPVERVKLITIWQIVTLHLEPQMYKPFNPILGETFQGVIGDYEIAIEQISHHPPISGFQLWSPELKDAPTCDGYLAYEASTGISSITGFKKGLIRVTFPDSGQVIEADVFPEFEMRGLMKGDRTFDYLKGLRVSDYKNNIHSDIIFNPDKKGWFRRMFSSSQKTAPDFFEGVISDAEELSFKDQRGVDLEKLQKDKRVKIFHKIEGNWTESVKIDDLEVWNNKHKYLTLQYVNNPLPSDWRFRTDLIALLNHDWFKAQEQKDELENIQREDRKLRKKAQDELKKKIKK